MQVIKYHDGQEVELNFDKKLHAYRVDGKPVASATKVLSVISKPALIPWALKQGSEWLERNLFIDDDEDDKVKPFKYTSRLGLGAIIKGVKSAYRGSSGNALETGSTAHQWIEDALEVFIGTEGNFGDDNLPDLPDDPDACNSIEAFKEWVGDNDIDFLSSEEKIYSRQDNYAGTLDCAAYVNGSLCIIDWKTSKGIYPEYHLQNAAYAQAWEDIHGKAVEQTLVLRLDKATGRYQEGFQSRVEWVRNYEAFVSALNLYNRLKELK
jgi:hypothetical protein